MEYNDYIKDAENVLYDYGKYEERKNFLYKRIKKAEMRGCPRDISAVDFAKLGHGSSGSDAINDILEVNHLIKQMQKLEDDKEDIDECLELIKKDNAEWYDFINYKYINNMPIAEVSERLGYSSNSVRTIYSIKDKALNKFIFYYWIK